MAGFIPASEAGFCPGWVCGGTARVTCSSGPAVSVPAVTEGSDTAACCVPSQCTRTCSHIISGWMGTSCQTAFTARDEIVTFMLLFLYIADRFKRVSAGLPDRGKPNSLINLPAYKFYTQISQIQTLGLEAFSWP